MKEMLKSKIMIGFIIFVLGFTYINASGVQNLEETNDENLVVYVK